MKFEKARIEFLSSSPWPLWLLKRLANIFEIETKWNVRDTGAKACQRVVSNVISRSSVCYVVRAYKDSLKVAQINLYFLNMAPPIHL